MPHVNLTEIISKMQLENLTPEIDVKGIKITQPDINRPALQLAGYFEHHEPTRVQIIGFVEYSYMEAMPEEKKLDKNCDLVCEVKKWVDEEYASGRVTVLTDEELIRVIDDACGRHGISLIGRVAAED